MEIQEHPKNLQREDLFPSLDPIAPILPDPSEPNGSDSASDTNVDNTNPSPKKKTNLMVDVIKLVSGTGAGIIITGLSMLILSRAYSVEAFGVYGIYSSIITILTIVACLQYEYTINLPSTHEDGANQLAVSVLSSLAVSLTTIPVIWLFGDYLTNYLKEPNLLPYLWLIPVNVFLCGLSIALNFWNTRTFKFGRLSILTVLNMFVTAAVQIGLSFRPNAGAGDLIIGSIAGIVVAAGMLAYRVWTEDHLLFKSSISWVKIRDGIHRYRKFPLLNTWANLINSISWQLPTFMLTRYFSSTINGYYNLGTRVMRVPMSLIGGAIGKAQYPRLAQAKTEGKLAGMVEKTIQMLIAYSMFPMLILTFVGKEAFVILFGAKWAEAGFYIQILSLWTLFWFISSPISTILDILEKQELLLRINLIVFFTRLLSLWIGGLMGQPRLAILLFAISGVLAYGYYALAIIQVSGVPIKNVLRMQGKYFLMFVPAGLILGLMKWFSASAWLLLAVALVMLIIYYIFIVSRDEIMMKSLEPIVTKLIKRK